VIASNYGNVSRTPDVVGTVARAWRIPLAAVGQRGRPDADGTVDGWLLFQPGAHILWTYWAITTVHLREIPGVKPAHLKFNGATHEVMVMALNPEQPLPDLEAVGRGDASFSFLTPIDICEQFIVNDDAQAAQLCELMVHACVDGYASPDQDWRRWWAVAIADTAQHLREGRHPETRA
jgi:hypothetical protein